LKQDNKRLKNEYLRTAGVLSRVADGTVVVDKNGHVLAMNPAAEELFGKRLAELAGKPINYGVNPDEHLVVLASDIEAALDSTAPENIQVMSRDSIEQTIRRSMALVHNETGNVVGTYMALPWTNQVKEALNRQEQFVARMTHELKAPLSSINSALELLDETVGPQLKPEERQFLSISIKNSRRLQSLIGEILNFSKLKSGAMSIAPKAVAVAPMIREALDALGPWARSKGVDLKGEAAQEDLAVFADPSRSVQVLTNLMSNAIKHTPAGGPVLVGAGKGQGEHIGSVVFYVQDSGPGIPKDDLDKIFKEFVQLGDGRGDGVGLGLAIAKELVERQKGEIWITSEEGKGSIFYFSLPSVAQEEPRNRAEPSWNEQLFQILSTHYRGS
ncbi:MAG: PAS domain-containing protein, partial [Elusimicrobia bacterium]|nr:PAS domain-containing protein [Elusimicrobiota bacterium]